MAYYQTRPFQRGDIYYIDYSNATGSEQRVGRPGLIVSSDQGNSTNPTVLIVYLSTKEQHARLPINVEVSCMSRRSWVLCNQIFCVDKSRCKDYKATVSAEEMRDIDRALAESLGLPYAVVTDPDSEKKLRAALDEKLHIEVERDYYKRLYEVALERLVGRKLEEDIPAKPEIPKSKAPQGKDTAAVAVDLNSCTPAELKRLGIREEVIARIISARPYKAVSDLRTVSGVTSIMYKQLEHRLCVGNVLVNINTASKEELVSALGISDATCQNIVVYRKKHGNFSSVDELLNVPRFGKQCLARCRGKVTV